MSSSHYHFCLCCSTENWWFREFSSSSRSFKLNKYTIDESIAGSEGTMSRLGKRFNNLIIIICGRNLCVFKWRASGDSLSSAVRDSRNQFSQNFNSIFDNTHYQTRAQILEYVQFSIGLCCAAVEMWNFCRTEPSRFFDYSMTCLWWSGKNLWLKSIFPVVVEMDIWDTFWMRIAEMESWCVWRAILR